MTHEPETDFAESVAYWFETVYGTENVQREVYQPEPRWFVDIVVDVGFATLFIEVENDAKSVRPGIAQALGYAAADQVAGVPVVVTPAGHLTDAKIERLRRSTTVPVREFDAERLEFVR